MGININFKRYLSLVTIIMIILSIIPCNAVKVFAEEINTIKVQILATTDLHGRFTSYEYASDMKSDGGLTQISTLIKEKKAENENTIVIDNGDSIQGNYNDLFLDDEENPMILAMNEIGYDVFNLGNNEFNLGMDKIKEIASESNENLNVLCANVYEDGKRVFGGYTIKTLNNKVKVAVIGVVASHITELKGPNLQGYTITDPIEEVGKVINEIKEQGGADIFVVSAHTGLDSEYENRDSAKEIAEKYDEVSAIIMGHKNEKNEEVKVNNAVLIQPGNKGTDLGQIQFELKKNKGKYEVVKIESKLISTKGVEDDQDLVEKITPYHERAIVDATSVIGTLDKDLAEDDEIKGIPESIVEDQGVTDFVNEVQLYYASEQLNEVDVNTDDIHLVSGAALFDVDSNIVAGDITKANISKIYKYDNKLYTIKTTGKQLKKYMEWSVSIYNTFKDGDLSVSLNENIRLYQYDMFTGVNYDVNLSNDPGSRVENLTYDGINKVKDEDVIYLAVNSYRYDSILNAPSNPVFDEGEHEKIYDTNNDTISNIRDLVIDYIVNVKNGEIERRVDNNWKLTGVDYDSEKRATVVRLVDEDKLKVPTSEDGRTSNVRSLTWDDVVKVVDKEVDIISFNDFHGNVLEDGKNIGAAKLASVIKEKQSLNSDDYEAITVAAGDLYQGTAISNLTYGKVVSEFLSAVNLTASAIGNHEFDWGIDKIEQWQNEGGFEFLAANIVDKESKNQVPWAEPYKIVESNGIKIGIIGITTEETAYKTNAENIGEIEFVSPEAVVNKYAKKLKEEDGVNAVIVLSHLGATQDSSSKEVTGEAANLAKSVYNVDAIIAAHDHKFTAGVVNNIPIVQGGYNGRGLANLNFKFNVDGKILSLEGTTEEVYRKVDEIVSDEEVASIISKYEEELGPILSEKITTLDRDLNHDSSSGLTKIGIVVSEAMREITGADIAITNGGGIRTSLNAGDITVGDLYTLLPFDNTVITVDLMGIDIKQVIEHGIMPNNMAWGQFSGIKVWYDSSKEYGDRITSINLADGTPMDMDKYYTVAINDFMLTGGDGYDFSAAIEVIDTNIAMRDSIMNLWKENGINTNIELLLIEGVDKESKIISSEEDEKDEVIIDKANKDNLPKTGGTNVMYIIIIAVVVIGFGIFLFMKKGNDNRKDS